MPHSTFPLLSPFLRRALFGAAISLAALPGSAQLTSASRILVVTGGHDYDATAFNAMWTSFGATYTLRALTTGHEVFDNITGWNYDILVFYNHQNPGNSLTARHKENFQALLNQGVGMFVLHHSVAAYPHFPEFEAMSGGKYRSAAYYSDNLSTYKIPVNINVLQAKTNHPLAQGIPASFTVNDEMYFKMTFAADNDVVFKTDYVDADGPIAWARTAGKSRVFTTIIGNGSGIFSNVNFRRMVKNGLEHVLPCKSGDTRDVCTPVVSLIALGKGRVGPRQELSKSFSQSHQVRMEFNRFAYTLNGRRFELNPDRLILSAPTP